MISRDSGIVLLTHLRQTVCGMAEAYSKKPPLGSGRVWEMPMPSLLCDLHPAACLLHCNQTWRKESNDGNYITITQ